MARKVAVVAFTARGAALCGRLLEAFGDGARGWAPEKYCGAAGLSPLHESVGTWAAVRFRTEDALIFVGAAGIAVRAVSPLAVSKGKDPAVICLDEAGRYVIPLLSGHLGGANELAGRLAQITGGQAVITTATDLRGVFSPDVWAVQAGCVVPRTDQIKHISAALLNGETVGLSSDYPVVGALPVHLREGPGFRCGIHLSLRLRQVYSHTLWLVPRSLSVGVGCRKGIDVQALEQAVLGVFRENELPSEAIGQVCTIDRKAEEKAIVFFCEKYKLTLKAYTVEQLNAVRGSRASSGFVRQTVGVDNVCERAALAGGGRLLVEKNTRDGVAVAVAEQDWSAKF